MHPKVRSQTGEPPADSEAERDAVQIALGAFKAGLLEQLRAALSPFASAPRLPATLVTLARASIVEGDFDTADRWLRRAESLFPEEPQVWKAFAILRRLQRRAGEELEYRRRLVPQAPGTAGAVVAFAQAFAEAHAKTTDPPIAELRSTVEGLTTLTPLESGHRAERLDIAQQLYQFKASQPEAMRLYAEASPCPANKRDMTVAWVSQQAWCDRAGVECRRALEHGLPGRRPTLAALERVLVLPGLQWAPLLDESHVAIDGFLMHRVKLQAEEVMSPILMHRERRQSTLRLPRDVTVIERPALLLGGMAQYYHNTVDFLGSLAVAELLDAPKDLPLVVNDDMAAFQLEQLSLLGIQPERLIRVKPDQALRFKTLWTPSRLVRTGSWMDPLLPQWYRRRLARPAQATRKLYLSRRGAGRRRVANEDAVMAVLRPLGYELVQPEMLGVAQQIELFSGASHIVGPTGAALTNMIYAPAGARVTVCYNRYMVAGGGGLYFDALARASGHSFSKFDCTPVDVHAVDRAIDADITVDLDQLRRALE